MNLLIDASNFGKSNHLSYDGKNYFWTNAIDENSIVLCGDPEKEYSIEHICKLLDIQCPSMISENQEKAFSELGVEISGIPSIMIQRPEDFKENLKKVTDWASEVYDILDEYSYIKTFKKELKLLRGMREAVFDSTSFNRWLLDKKIDKKVKKSFSTNKFGYLERVVYNNYSTRTGRIVTESGPQLLTTQKEIRGFLKSRYKGGKIIQFDFISLEPRVALSSAGNNSQKDVYEMFNENYFSNSLERSQIKKLVLCALYGAGVRTLKKILPPDVKPSKAVNHIRDSMNFNDLVSAKKQELEKKSFMSNIFGRSIVPSSDRDSIIFNNWVQSSAVDVSLLGFQNLIEELRSENLNFEPIFLIHDALVIDASPDMVKKIEKESQISIFIKELGHFPLSVEYLG